MVHPTKDRVKVSIEIFRGKKEAHVIEILERGYSRIVGRVEKSAYFAYVIPFVKNLGLYLYSTEVCRGSQG